MMLSALRTTRRVLNSETATRAISVRHLLRSAFNCDHEWRSLVQNAYTSVVDSKDHIPNFGDHAFNVTNILTAEKKLSEIDFDYFVSRLPEMSITNIDYTESIFEKFNSTQESLNMLPATAHTIMRSYIDLGQPRRFLRLLTDKYRYGLFLDPCGSCIFMNHFIKSGDIDGGFDAVWDFVTQEDFDHPLSVSLAVYICSNKLKKMFQEGVYHPPAPVVEEDDDEDKYIVVRYIRRPYYDDHFDIECRKLRLGKTLMLLGNEVDDDVTRLSSRLIGALLYEKIPKVVALIDSLDADSRLHSDVSELMEWALQCITELKDEDRDPDDIQPHELLPPRLTEQELRDFTALWENKYRARVSKCCDRNTEKLSAALRKWSERRALAQEDISRQEVLKQYEEFAEDRRVLYTAQYNRRRRLATESEVKKRLRDLVDKEETITYFDNLEQIRYKAWLADRTREEKRMTAAKEWEKNIAKLPKKSHLRYEPLDYDQ